MSHDERDYTAPSALFTDLYELTMAQVYHAEGMDEPGEFELFYRTRPARRNYVMAAGLDHVLACLERLRFEGGDLDYLREHTQLEPSFLERLAEFRFTGDVYAVPEGTLVFPHEPIVQVLAPVLEAQLVETLVLNQIHAPSVMATKAARIVTAAAGRSVVDFGSRRSHGVDAALKVARASYIAGAAGTSNVLAGRRYGIPIFGTMAHSYVQAFEDESVAFETFARHYPDSTLLVDTYDTIRGVERLVDLQRRLGAQFRVAAIRLDSGDLGELALAARRKLDEADLNHVRIFASSGLDEYLVADLVQGGAPIDGFGVGTALAVAEDAPSLDVAYKLVGYAGTPRTKLSSDKVIYPGRKQVYRIIDDGSMTHDVIARHDEPHEGEPLLVKVMAHGRRTEAGNATLEDARRRAAQQVEMLPPSFLELDQVEPPYPVRVSTAVKSDLQAARSRLG